MFRPLEIQRSRLGVVDVVGMMQAVLPEIMPTTQAYIPTNFVHFDHSVFYAQRRLLGTTTHRIDSRYTYRYGSQVDGLGEVVDLICRYASYEGFIKPKSSMAALGRERESFLSLLRDWIICITPS